MISHLELENKAAKILGVASADHKIGFEIFVKMIGQKLNFGDTLRIDNLGYFTLKKIKPISGKVDFYHKLILFSEKQITKQTSDLLLFFLPSEASPAYNPIDSYLNLSIAKPLILLSDINAIASPSGDEKIGLIESKVENLLLEVEKIPKFSDEDEFYSLTAGRVESATVSENISEPGSFDKVTANVEHNESELKGTHSSTTNQLNEYQTLKSSEDLIDSDVPKKKLFFDDIELQQEAQSSQESAELNHSSNITTTGTHENKYLKEYESEANAPAKSSKKSFRRKLIYTFLAALIFVSAIMAAYLNLDKIRNFISSHQDEKPKISAVIEKSRPVIIERVSEFTALPIYSDEPAFIDRMADSMIIDPAVFITKHSADSQKISEETAGSPLSKPVNELVRITNNIFQRADEFVVQLSSWKSKKRAERELNRLLEKGFATELIQSTNNDGNRIYKIMVSGFKSLDEAKEYLKQNK